MTSRSIMSCSPLNTSIISFVSQATSTLATTVCVALHLISVKTTTRAAETYTSSLLPRTPPLVVGTDASMAMARKINVTST